MLFIWTTLEAAHRLDPQAILNRHRSFIAKQARDDQLTHQHNETVKGPIHGCVFQVVLAKPKQVAECSIKYTRSRERIEKTLSTFSRQPETDSRL
jgi:hypothetical protein